MSEKLCLQWNDFQDNIMSVFGNLRKDNDFADVTLACEDDQPVEAHKVILAGQVFFSKLSHSQHRINNINIMINIKSVELQTRGWGCR